MCNRFSTTSTLKHGIDHSMVSSIQNSSNAVPIWNILIMTEKEYNAKCNPPLITHASCQCKISLPTQVYMFSIRRSRLYMSVCTIKSIIFLKVSRTFFAQRHSDVEFDPSISRTFYQT